jgi:hypothetical protein
MQPAALQRGANLLAVNGMAEEGVVGLCTLNQVDS